MMTISELLPEVSTLSHADKFRLVQLLLAQLAKEDNSAQQKASDKAAFNPRDYFGAARASKQEVDSYLQTAREGWN